MLDVHPPHSSVHGWRDFFIHIATITIGLLIALGLEAMVEAVHHRHEVSETREALSREISQNRERFAQDTLFSRHQGQIFRDDLMQLTSATPSHTMQWDGSYNRMDDEAWRTAQASGVTALMPQEEVRSAAELYSFFDRMDRAHEEEADAIAEAIVSLGTAAPSSNSSPTAIALVQHVLAKHLRHALLMQNLAERFPDFSAPTREDIATLMQPVSASTSEPQR